ncbi:hypothetical protein [Haladaptatus pallidirubidus]|nr:hypothetical protein [Haladaptatus pallidirubidus]
MENQGDRERRPATRSTFGGRFRTMGRRRFVSTLLGAGFGSMATLLTPDDVKAAGRNEVPLVYAHENNLKPRTTMVSADWFEDLRSAFDAHRRLNVASTPGVVGSAVVPGEFGGRNAALSVDVTGSEVGGAVPEHVGDVAVELNRVGSTPSGATRNDRSDSFGGKLVPGGVKCGSRDSAGTLAPAMYDGTSPFFATSNHVFGGDAEQHSGEPFFVHGDGDPRKIGEVRRGYQLDDFVRIDPTGGFRPTNEIFGASPSTVVGQFTREGLAELKARGEKLEKVAFRSGHSDGQLHAIDGLTCAYGKVCKRGQLKWGSQSDFTDGDSGSVNYHTDPENPESGVLVGGFNNARTWWPGEDYIWGTSAYRITNHYGFTFSPLTAGSR